MSASLAKLTCSVTYAKSICFIQETANDSPHCWLGNPGNGRVRFMFFALGISASLSLCLCLIFSSLHWKDLNSFWGKKKSKVRSFQWMMLHFLADSLTLKSEIFVSYREIAWAIWKPSEQFRLQVKSVSILKLFLIQKQHTNCHSIDY